MGVVKNARMHCAFKLLLVLSVLGQSGGYRLRRPTVDASLPEDARHALQRCGVKKCLSFIDAQSEQSSGLWNKRAVEMWDSGKTIAALCFGVAALPSDAWQHYSNLAFVLTRLGRPGMNVDPPNCTFASFQKQALQLAVRAADEAVRLQPRAYDALFSGGYALVHLGGPQSWDAAASRIAQANALLRLGHTERLGVHNWLTGREFGDGDLQASVRFKLRHDAAQLEHLVERGTLSREFLHVAAAYELGSSQVEHGPSFGHHGLHAFTSNLSSLVQHSYNQLLHVHPAPALRQGALRQTLPSAVIEAGYFGKSQGVLGNGVWAPAPGVVVLDDVLSPEALTQLLRFCQDSTIYFDVRSSGYLGVDLGTGFVSGLHLQAADQLRKLLPSILEDHGLVQMWSYKHDSNKNPEGIKAHADDAAVNCNLWLTADEANLAPGTGGLKIYSSRAETSASFLDINARAAVRQYDDEEDVIEVPYKQNRMILFDSSLFHATSPFKFKQGYKHRRINITFLFGVRGELAETRGKV